MLTGNTVKFTHMPLGLVPEILDAINVVFLIGKQLRMIDPIVFKFADIQHVIASPAVRINDAIRNDFVLDNWH